MEPDQIGDLVAPEINAELTWCDIPALSHPSDSAAIGMQSHAVTPRHGCTSPVHFGPPQGIDELLLETINPGKLCLSAPTLLRAESPFSLFVCICVCAVNRGKFYQVNRLVSWLAISL